MEDRRFSRLFRSSFLSCRSRNRSDAIGDSISVSAAHRSTFDPNGPPPPSDPGPPRLSFICCRRTLLDTFSMRGTATPRHGESQKTKALAAADGRSTPISPLNPLDHELRGFPSPEKSKKKNKKKAHWTGKKKTEPEPFCPAFGPPPPGFYGGGEQFSGEEESDDENEDETATFFSSRSNTLSSASSGSRRNAHGARRPGAPEKKSGEGVVTAGVGRGKVMGSLAVVKRSRDPYRDFRASMAEMIVEKRMFGAEDLQHLLDCFLSLNSADHHIIIVRVFQDILEAIFCNLV